MDLAAAGLGGEPGFDAVIGNPPYVPNEQMSRDERGYYAAYYPVSLGKYDLSVIFLSKGSQLLSVNCRLGMIVPTTWQTGDNYLPFRKMHFANGRDWPICGCQSPI